MMWISLSLLTIAVAGAGQTVQLRFSDLKKLVESQNDRVIAKGKEAEGAMQRKGHLLRSFLPSLQVQAGQEHFEKGPLPAKTQPTFGVEVSANLYNGHRDQIENQKLVLRAERRHIERLQVEASELAKARELYWSRLYLRDYVKLLKTAQKDNAESLRAAVRRIRGGVSAESDRFEFEMQQSDLKREIERQQLAIINQERQLKLILGIDSESQLVLDENLEHEHDWQEALRHTEKDHAFLVRPVEIRAREAQADAQIRKRAWLPRVDAFAAVQQFNQREEEDYERARDRQESVVGVRLSMNVFDGFSGYKEGKALTLEAESAQAEARYREREVEAHLHGELAELQLLHNQVHEAEENILRAEKYYRLTRSEYGRGVKNSPDMLGATEKLIEVRQRRLMIVRDFQIAKSHVLTKIGR